MDGYIYEIRNKINNKIYIGQTINPYNRKIRHFGDLRAGKHDNPHLQKAFLKYGEENFEFNILLKLSNCTVYELDEKEIEYIKKYDSYLNGYNCNKGGQYYHEPTSKFTKEDVFNIKAVSKFHKRYGTILANYYNTSNTTIYRINHNIQCCVEGEEFDKLTEKEQKNICDNFILKTNLIQERHKIMTGLTKTRLYSKEQIFLIYIYQEYNNGKRCFISQDIGINNCNTLRCIRNKITYQDYYDEYTKLTIDQKLEILCPYLETYKRKPPELLENLVKTRQSAAKPN